MLWSSLAGDPLRVEAAVLEFDFQSLARLHRCGGADRPALLVADQGKAPAQGFVRPLPGYFTKQCGTLPARLAQAAPCFVTDAAQILPDAGGTLAAVLAAQLQQAVQTGAALAARRLHLAGRFMLHGRQLLVHLLAAMGQLAAALANNGLQLQL